MLYKYAGVFAFIPMINNLPGFREGGGSWIPDSKAQHERYEFGAKNLNDASRKIKAYQPKCYGKHLIHSMKLERLEKIVGEHTSIMSKFKVKA